MRVASLFVASLTLVVLGLMLPGGRAARQADKDQLAQEALALLETKCGECHGEKATAGFTLRDYPAMLAKGQITPGQPDKSRIYIRAALSPGDPMPPSNAKDPKPLTAPQTAVLKAWIEAGASQPTKPASLAGTSTTPARLAPGTRINPKDGAEMVFIPAGAFLMGDEDQRDNPRRKVTLSGYYIYKNLVTVAMYEKFCQQEHRTMPPSPSFNADWSKKDHPIVNVSWDDAMAYCRWAGVTLPTEAQWEKAARGTEGRKYPWGDRFDSSKLWCSTEKYGDAGGTAPVGSFPSGVSPYGVLDMVGNVWQWCLDYYDEDFPKGRLASRPDPVNDSVGKKETRVLRGGSWTFNDPYIFRAGYRDWDTPSNWLDILGIRCVSPEPLHPPESSP